MKNQLVRFRPYLRYKEVILFERLRETTNISIGNILMALLVESETFVKLSQYTDATDEEIKNVFMGLPIESDIGHNKEKKEEQ